MHVHICSIDFPNGQMCPIRYRTLVQVFAMKSSVSKLCPRFLNEFCGFYDFEKSTTYEFPTFRGQTWRAPFSICPRFMRLFDAVWTTKSATAPIFVLKFIRQCPVTAALSGTSSMGAQTDGSSCTSAHRSNPVPKNSLQCRAIPQSC